MSRRTLLLRSVWRRLCRRREGDDMLIVYATFVICFVLFAR